MAGVHSVMLRRRIQSNDALDSVLLKLDTRAHGPAHLPAAAKVQGKAAAMEGKVSLNARGFAFITGEDGEAYFVRANLARFLLTGDQVRFIPVDGKAGDSREVRALVTVSRSAGRLLCEVHQVAGLTHLVSDEPCFLPLQLAEAPVGAHDFVVGDVVSVSYAGFDGAPTARPLMLELERNLGPRSRPGFDLDYALMRFGFDALMPELDVDTLGAQSGGASWQGAKSIPFVTIDGESTRDFDDAVYAKPLSQGGWEVQVAVADVSWYVQEGSTLDRWAAARCTSLYLPGRTLPMLPESLSTDRCSLLPGQLRRAVVLKLEVNVDGSVRTAVLERTLIESAARLTYGQVAGFMQGRQDIRFSMPVEQSLRALAEVYRVLAARRDDAGRLEFDEPEPTMVQAADGSWTLAWESRNDAHKLIEELMLLANRTAANMLVRRYGAGLFRHQPAPKPEAWQDLQAWARARAHALPQEPCLRSMAQLVSAQPSVEAQVAASLKIRSAMRPARYVVQRSHEQGGHFSLSVDWYTHFTSPIRRYADLLVHRLLLAPEDFTLSEEAWAELERQVAQCSERGQSARLAERMVWDRLKLQGFMASSVPTDVFPARVVRSNQRGLRVVVNSWQCSAWLPGADLRSHGYQWLNDMWTSPAEGVGPLHEGAQLPVSWTALVLERPAYPELQVRLNRG